MTVLDRKTHIDGGQFLQSPGIVWSFEWPIDGGQFLQWPVWSFEWPIDGDQFLLSLRNSVVIRVTNWWWPVSFITPGQCGPSSDRWMVTSFFYHSGTVWSFQWPIDDDQFLLSLRDSVVIPVTDLGSVVYTGVEDGVDLGSVVYTGVEDDVDLGSVVYTGVEDDVDLGSMVYTGVEGGVDLEVTNFSVLEAVWAVPE